MRLQHIMRYSNLPWYMLPLKSKQRPVEHALMTAKRDIGMFCSSVMIRLQKSHKSQMWSKLRQQQLH